MAIKRFILPINASGTIQSLRTTNVTQTTIALAWDVYPGATGYEIRRNGTLVQTWNSGTQTTYSNSGHTAGTSYTYAVRPVVGGSGVASAQASIVVVTAGGSIGVVVGTVYNDSFEPVTGRTYLAGGGTMTIPNASGFAWSANNATSVVRDDQYVVYDGSPVMTGPIEGRFWENGPGIPGRHALRFRYGAGANMSEQRFAVGSHVPDLWMRYWIRVPIAYSHPTGGSSNNKWLAVWCAAYDQLGDVTFQLRASGDGNSRLVVQDGGVSVGEVLVWEDFINATRDRGRWMQLVYRFKAATAPGANNGIIDVYRRWEDESSWTQIYNKTNAQFHQNDGNPSIGIHEGYLMGWANAPYPAATEWLVDDFTLSAQDLR